MTPAEAATLAIGAVFLAAVAADVIAGIAGRYPARPTRFALLVDLLLLGLLVYGVWWVGGR